MKIFAGAFVMALVMAVPAMAEQVTPIGEVKRGTMVTVAGNVERILDSDEFRLADETGSIRVYVGPNWVPAEVGESVTVAGFVDNDIGRLELYARTLTRADGTSVQFEHRYD
ncbi:MAG: hypothetical protein V2J42_07385 [Wenzhouxiangella sp.]|jgi:uncharacterized protein YdeI (BOF family)|nr:hypothetical protein [Wenzhouxiangella sp.]